MGLALPMYWMQHKRTYGCSNLNLLQKLVPPFYCFHDTDVAGDGSVFEIESRLAKNGGKKLKAMQDASGVQLLWGTANVFSNCPLQ